MFKVWLAYEQGLVKVTTPPFTKKAKWSFIGSLWAGSPFGEYRVHAACLAITRARRLSSWVPHLSRVVDKTDRETTLDLMSYFKLYSRNIACPTLTETGTQHCKGQIRRRKIKYHNRWWINHWFCEGQKNRLLLITSLGRSFVQKSKCKLLSRGTDARGKRDQIYRNNFLPVLVCPSLNLEIWVHFLLSCSYEVRKVSIVKLKKAWDWAWRQFSVCQKDKNRIK